MKLWAISTGFLVLAVLLCVAPVPTLGGVDVPAPPPPALPALPAATSPDATQLTTRPLFSASRRAAATAVAPVTAPSPNGLVLLGVLQAGGQAEALVSQAGQTPQLVALGANLGGWVVTKISAMSITLQAGSSGAELDLPAPGLPPGFSAQPQIPNRGN